MLIIRHFPMAVGSSHSEEKNSFAHQCWQIARRLLAGMLALATHLPWTDRHWPVTLCSQISLSRSWRDWARESISIGWTFNNFRKSWESALESRAAEQDY